MVDSIYEKYKSTMAYAVHAIHYPRGRHITTYDKVSVRD
jgi:hypothetical protein